MIRNVQTGLSGRAKVAVLSGGHVVEERRWEENLILNQGLDKIATVLFNQLFANCALGDNNSPTTIDPQSNATVSAQTLTLAAPANYTFTNNDLDSGVHFDTGEFFIIQSIVNATTVTLFAPGTISAATHFMLLRVNQAGLGNELKRTNIYSTVPSANEAIYSAGNVLLQRTFLFPTETSTITYKELGFSDLTVAGPNLFSRIVLATPVTLSGPSSNSPGGQQLQVTYQLVVNFDYGQGAGKFVAGTNPTTISITGLPLSFQIWNYAASSDVPSQLVVSAMPSVPVWANQPVTIANSSVAAYNGPWTVQSIASYSDATHGQSSLLTLNTAFTSNPAQDGGLVKTNQDGIFFRPCQGIYTINSSGGSAAPVDSPDLFVGYGEPSIAGTAWIASDPAANLGSNGNPVRARSAVQTVGCALLTYTPGSFYIDKQATFTVVTLNPIYSFGVGEPDLTNQIETWAFNEGQALGQNSTFELTFRFSWGRSTF
jgi:hypothetical protein